jgi:phospholipase D-like protein
VVLLVTAVVIVWVLVWLMVAYRILTRDDIGVAAKIVWIILILIFNVVGLFVYFLWDAMKPRTT